MREKEVIQLEQLLSNHSLWTGLKQPKQGKENTKKGGVVTEDSF